MYIYIEVVPLSISRNIFPFYGIKGRPLAPYHISRIDYL